MSLAKKYNDKRQHLRHEAQDLSEILTDNVKYSCLIHDISDHGAKLQVSCGELAERFILVNHKKQTRALCQTVWRDGDFIGVRFLKPPRKVSLT